jgi:NAD(P)-dependent dehydrogenase (short-subunit alcohol dehydrogenase family)
MKISVEGKRVLVTAAGSGIGRAIAEAFAEDGAAVHISDVSEISLAAVRESTPDIGVSLADASDCGASNSLIGVAIEQMGGIDILINNVGVKGPTGPIEDNDPEEWSRSIDINLKGHFYAAHAAVPHIKQAGGGAIITLSSVAGRLGFPNRTAYAAAKWALIGMTQSLAMELGPFNIRANAILPGNVNGDRMEQVLAGEAEAEGITVKEARERTVRTTSMGAWIDPEEIAALAVFLASDASRHISGQSVGICGNLETLGIG